MKKSLEEWEKILEKLSGEDLENITKGANSIKKIDDSFEEIPGLKSLLWSIGELADIILNKRLKDMERVKSPEELWARDKEEINMESSNMHGHLVSGMYR
jgi:hypothetical protein